MNQTEGYIKVIKGLKITLPTKVAKMRGVLASAKERNDLLRLWGEVRPAGLTHEESIDRFNEILRRVCKRDNVSGASLQLNGNEVRNVRKVLLREL